jgi:FKBP-type peptidyl-prolyl cis-trans isomerase
MKNKIKLIRRTTIILAFICVCFSCKDKSYTFQDEMDKLNQYIVDNNIITPPKPSGLYYIETLAGTGVYARVGLYVSVRYKGYFLDGTVFDQNLDADKPLTFILGYGNVIPGWDEGILLMKSGGKATLIIPSTLAYGYQGSGPVPAYTTIIFDVELVNVE